MDGRPTVLHVDDCPNDATLVQAACVKAKASFHLQNVEGGEQAMAYLNGAGKFGDRNLFPTPSLMLLDLKMPRANGVEILQWVRHQSAFRELPVIVLSGSELQDDMRRAYTAGANSYFVKPLKFESLVDLIKNISVIWLSNASRPTTTVLPAFVPPSAAQTGFLDNLH